MLALAKFKEGDDKFSKFMEWMQSNEGMAERSKFAIPSKTIGTVTPDKSVRKIPQQLLEKVLWPKEIYR